MVQIIVKSSLGKTDGIGEWYLIELQGDLQTKGEKLEPQTIIGDVHFTKYGIPILIIGHHILYGKVMDIDKPLVVLLKSAKRSDAEPDGNTASSYKAAAFIKKKLLFKTRPKPIISYIPKKR